MKTTGIVRKLDQLGRVVIPREYRKLYKIKIGDPLEITAMENGDIVVRKVDLSVELITNGQPMLNALAETIGLDVAVANEEKILLATGSLKESAGGTQFSAKTQSLIEKRRVFSGKASEIDLSLAPYAAFAPVYGDDLFGAILAFSNEPIAQNIQSYLTMTAKILGAAMQKF